MPNLSRRGQRSESSMCRAVKADGERCRAIAGSDGLCSLHRDPGRAKELGRLGGSRSPMTKLRRSAGDELRDQAAHVLGRAVRGEPVTRQEFDAAKALFSFGPTRPPAEQGAPDTERDRAVELWRKQLDWEKVLFGLWEAGVLRCSTCDGPMGGGDTVHGPNPPVIRAERLAKEMGGRLNDDDSEVPE